MKVAICCPTRDRPHQAFLDALERSIPALDAAGWEHSAVFEIGCPYISGARATMLRKAMRWGADVFVFLDDDVSWRPDDLVRLIAADGDVVAGTYRFKVQDAETYMGFLILGEQGRPMARDDGLLSAYRVPAGFLKVTRAAVDRFMTAYPDLVIDAEPDGFRSVDLFNHGAHKGVWFGEDYAFCRRWLEIGGEIWVLADAQLDHNGADGKVWPGNLHECLLRAPGGAREAVKEAA